MKTCLLIFLLGFSTMIFSQQSVEEQILQETISNSLQSVPQNNQVTIAQNGEDNQVQSATSGAHQTQVLQIGNNNSAVVDLQGDQNQVDLSQQGNDNEYLLLIDGTSNRLQTQQYGIGNKVTQELEGAGDLNMEVLQIGTGHELILISAEEKSASMRVIQQGTPTSIIIEKIDF